MRPAPLLKNWVREEPRAALCPASPSPSRHRGQTWALTGPSPWPVQALGDCGLARLVSVTVSQEREAAAGPSVPRGPAPSQSPRHVVGHAWSRGSWALFPLLIGHWGRSVGRGFGGLLRCHLSGSVKSQNHCLWSVSRQTLRQSHCVQEGDGSGGGGDGAREGQSRVLNFDGTECPLFSLWALRRERKGLGEAAAKASDTGDLETPPCIWQQVRHSAFIV